MPRLYQDLYDAHLIMKARFNNQRKHEVSIYNMLMDILVHISVNKILPYWPAKLEKKVLATA